MDSVIELLDMLSSQQDDESGTFTAEIRETVNVIPLLGQCELNEKQVTALLGNIFKLIKSMIMKWSCLLEDISFDLVKIFQSYASIVHCIKDDVHLVKN